MHRLNILIPSAQKMRRQANWGSLVGSLSFPPIPPTPGFLVPRDPHTQILRPSAYNQTGYASSQADFLPSSTGIGENHSRMGERGSDPPPPHPQPASPGRKTSFPSDSRTFRSFAGQLGQSGRVIVLPPPHPPNPWISRSEGPPYPDFKAFSIQPNGVCLLPS
jgi:hypothetical protein